MQHPPTVVPLRWYGARSLREARGALRRGQEVHIELPLNIHYALFMHLHPQAQPGAAQNIDAAGGAELLAALATFPGLEKLAGLQAEVRRADYRVRLRSPEPTLMLQPPVSHVHSAR